METKKITIDEIQPKEVNTKFGKKTLYNIKDIEGDIYTCWDKEFTNELPVGEPTEVKFEVSQNGKYTTRTIVSPKSQLRKFLTADDVKQIVDDAKNEILNAIAMITK